MMRPSLIMVSEPGSFAERTIVHRKPQIIANVIAHNDYAPAIVDALNRLACEIANGIVQPLRDEAEDGAFWQDAWSRWRGCTWRQLGWFFAETYFYRRLLETVHYFRPGPWYGADPFAHEKREALVQGLVALTDYAPWPDDWPPQKRIAAWLLRSLWGNRADLSNMTIQRDLQTPTQASSEHLLVDDSRAVAERLARGQVGRVDWIADNSGLEIAVDLGMIDMLLSEHLVREVRVHVKPQPYFVSDAMIKDVEHTLDALAAHSDAKLSAMGQRLQVARDEGRMRLETHPFWATCLGFDAFPRDLAETLGQADLLVFKGDVNYRRLLDDRHWPPTTPMKACASYMPAPFCVLRTLKGELIVGLREGQAEALAERDADWLINGQRGVIHLVVPR